MRKASIDRRTTETRISASVDLDGTGAFDVKTGVGFLDHMLESFSRHSLIDLKVRAQGDLHVDFHHTTEDTAIVIGQAIKKALGDFAGIRRFGSCLMPMDETLTRVAIDISNRPYLIWKVNIPKPKLGEMDTELFKEWFQAFAQAAGLTLHVETLYGENNHHVIEGIFKGFARAFGKAVAIDPRNGDVLALVSTPAFDPNRFAAGLSRADYNALTIDIDKPLVNRALAGTYPPGSTVKPFISLVALEHETIDGAAVARIIQESMGTSAPSEVVAD